MAPKRKEMHSSPVKQAKKAKSDPLTKKLQHQLQEVTAALNQAEITKQVEKMLATVLPLSLGDFKDQRHPFQEQVVGGIEALLGEIEAALNAEVAEKRKAVDDAAGEQPLREKEAAEATDKLTAKGEEVQGLKVVLAGKAKAFRAATSALTEAEDAKTLDGQKVREAEKKKSDFQVAVEHLRALKTASTDDAEGAKTNKELMALLKKYKFEESMMIALPAALGKAPDARGQFDLMAIAQLEGEIEKMIAEQDAVLTAAVPGQQACDAAIKAAQEKLALARGEQRVAAKAFDAANNQRSECEEASSAAQKAVRDRVTISKRLAKALHNAEVEVELFQQGPLETFKELRDRMTPPPQAEEQEEVAVDEQMPVAEPEAVDVHVPEAVAAA